MSATLTRSRALSMKRNSETLWQLYARKVRIFCQSCIGVHPANSSKGGTIPLHLRAQNCGVLISKEDTSVHFEAFELSPLNESVITTKGRLQRSFPGPAFSVERNVFGQAAFLETTAQTLAKMSHQAAIGTTPQVRKAGRMHNEDRDTVHPKMVTELFAAFLRSVGEPVEVSRLWKNTREEVMWKDSKFSSSIFSPLSRCSTCCVPFSQHLSLMSPKSGGYKLPNQTSLTPICR
jgi:hypothetical protein